MNTRDTVDITRSVIELAVNKKSFSTRQLLNKTVSNVSKRDVEKVLDHLQDIGWVERTNTNVSVWKQGPNAKDCHDSIISDDRPFRVLPDEVPKGENIR